MTLIEHLQELEQKIRVFQLNHKRELAPIDQWNLRTAYDLLSSVLSNEQAADRSRKMESNRLVEQREREMQLELAKRGVMTDESPTFGMKGSPE